MNRTKKVCAPRPSSRSAVETPFFYQSAWYILPRGSRQRIKLIGGSQAEKDLWKSGKRFGDGCFQMSDEVKAAYGSWLALREAPKQRDAMRTDALCELYLQNCEVRTSKPIKPRTLKLYQTHLERFCKRFGAASVSSLTPISVEAWVGTVKVLATRSSRRQCLKTIKQVFNWAVAHKIIDESPVTALELPDDDRRDYLISEAEE